MTTIILNALSKHYGKSVAIDQLSLWMEGGIIGLLGPNGAGKTTLIRMLTGFLRPTHGTIQLGEHQLGNDSQLQAMRRHLGYVPQKVAFYPTWTAAEFVDYIAQLKGLHHPSQRREAVQTSLERVGLTEHGHKKTAQLSGGMARRLAIAQAIVNDPQILIVDEPTAGLDPEERMRFRAILTRLGAERLVLFSTHIVDDIDQTCQQVIILNRRILYAGAIKALLAQTDAQAQVWEVSANEPLDESRFMIVSSRQTDDGYRYRIVGSKPDAAQVQPAASTLEDAYAEVMQRQRTSPTI